MEKLNVCCAVVLASKTGTTGRIISLGKTFDEALEQAALKGFILDDDAHDLTVVTLSARAYNFLQGKARISWDEKSSRYPVIGKDLWLDTYGHMYDALVMMDETEEYRKPLGYTISGYHGEYFYQSSPYIDTRRKKKGVSFKFSAEV